jgi:chromosome segregation ATPase
MSRLHEGLFAMVSNADALKKKIDELKKQLAAHKESSNADMKARALRKELKRAQRRFASLTPLSLESQLKRSQKILDLIGKTLGEITKGAKKVVGNPYVHSLRKKTKSYNKRIKKVNRLLEKRKKDGASTAPEPKPAEGAPPPA